MYVMCLGPVDDADTLLLLAGFKRSLVCNPVLYIQAAE